MTEHLRLTPLSYYPRLSASENHKGFSLADSEGRLIGEVYPGDQDGVIGEANAAFIVRAVNAFEPMREALEAAYRQITGYPSVEGGAVDGGYGQDKDNPLPQQIAAALAEGKTE